MAVSSKDVTTFFTDLKKLRARYLFEYMLYQKQIG